jgi:hypothetical protein
VEWEVGEVFKTEGPLGPDETHLYVERAEDGEVAANVRSGDYVALIGARLTGKTSLLLRLRRNLLKAEHVPVYLDLSPAKDAKQREWYSYLHDIIQQQLKRTFAELSIPSFDSPWSFHESLRGISTNLTSSERIVVLLDEVSAIPPSITGPFFSTVRAIFNERESQAEFGRYAFVMAGAFIPDKLVDDPKVSPFNIAEHIYMSDGEISDVRFLTEKLRSIEIDVSEEVSERIYHWTDGHLYLTQRLCSILEEIGERHPTVELVNRSVDELIGDKGVRRIYRKLDKNPVLQATAEEILTGAKRRRFNRATLIVTKLELIGLVKEDPDGYCVIRNRVYRRALRRFIEQASRDEKPSAAVALVETSTGRRLGYLGVGALIFAVLFGVVAVVIGSFRMFLLTGLLALVGGVLLILIAEE